MKKQNKITAFIISLIMLCSLYTSPIVSADETYAYNDSAYYYKFYSCSVLNTGTARIGLNASFKNFLKGLDSSGNALTDLTTPYTVSSDSDGNPTVLYNRGEPLPNIFSVPCANSNVTAVQLWNTFNNLSAANAVKTFDFSLCIPTRDVNLDLSYTFGDNSSITSLDMTPFGNEHLTVTVMNSTFIRANYLHTITGLEKLMVTSKLTGISNVFYGASRLKSFDLSTWDMSGMTSAAAFNGTSVSVAASLRPVTVYVKDAYAKKLCDAQNNTNLNFVIKENQLSLVNEAGTAADDYHSFTAKLSAKDTMSGTIVAAALYDSDERLISCQTADAAEEIPFSFDINGKKLKVMWLDKTTLTPMTESKEIVDKSCTDILFDTDTYTFNSTESQAISYTLVPSDTTDTAAFESSNTAIAAVDASGNITPVSNGECSITVSCGSITKTIAVTVNISGESSGGGDTSKPCTAITADEAITFNGYSEPQTISYTLEPADTTDTAAFESDNAEIAAVDSSGKVEPKGVGECSITIKCGSITKTISVTVTEQLCSAITLSRDKLTFNEPEEQAVIYSLAPSNTTQTVAFKSSDEDIAAVDENGIVTPIKQGTCEITITCGEATKTVKVTVNDISQLYTSSVSYNYAINNNIGETIEKNGVTIVNNSDGSVTCSGICSEDFTYSIDSAGDTEYNISAPSGLYYYSAKNDIPTSLVVKSADNTQSVITEEGVIELNEGDTASYNISFTSGTSYDSTVYPALYKGQYDRTYEKAGLINYLPKMEQYAASFGNMFSDMNINTDKLLIDAKTPMYTWVDDDFYPDYVKRLYDIAEENEAKITFAAMYFSLTSRQTSDGVSGLELAKKYHAQGHEIAIHDLGTGGWGTAEGTEAGIKQYLSYLDLNGFVNCLSTVAPGGNCSAEVQEALKKYVRCCCNAGSNGYPDLDGRFNLTRMQIRSNTTTDNIKRAIDDAANSGGWVIFFTHSAEDANWNPEVIDYAMKYAKEKGVINTTLTEAINYRQPIYDIREMFMGN